MLQPPDGRGHAPVCPRLHARGSRWYVVVGIEKMERGERAGLCMCVIGFDRLCVSGWGSACLGSSLLCVTPRPVYVCVKILDLMGGFFCIFICVLCLRV